MKTKNLMIGDWIEAEVQIDDTGKKPVLEKLKKRITDLSTIGYRVEVTLQDYANFGATLNHIPLTPEILELNNFKKDPDYIDTYWRPDCNKFCFVRENKDWYFAIRYKGGHICIAECNYVYKFRHILIDLLDMDTDVIVD